MRNFRVPRESRQRESRVERDVMIGLDLAAAAWVYKACAISRQGTFFICIVFYFYCYCLLQHICDVDGYLLYHGQGVPVLLLLLPLHHLGLGGLEDPLLPVIDQGNLAVVHVVFQEMHFDAKLLHFL